MSFDVMGYDYDKEQQKLAEHGGRGLTKYPEAIMREGDNVFMVLPGTRETGGNMMLPRRVHGFRGGGCVRATSDQRFEECPKCDYWWKNRTSKENREKGISHPADVMYPADRGIIQVINVTPFVEHESKRDGDKVIEKPVSDEIDMDRVRKKPCFLDENVIDPSSKKCKECFALYSCFQGPQFLPLSGDRVKDYTDKLAKLGGKKIRTGSVKIGGKKISLKGNLALAWWKLTAEIMGATTKDELKKARKIAKSVGYPFVMTKIVDPKISNKQHATKYRAGFGSSTFVMPASWQERALARARDLVEYCAPISVKQARKELKAYIRANSDKPACFDDDETKDTDGCPGRDACKYYDECCAGKKKESSEKKKRGGKKKKKTKQDRVDDMRDDEFDDDALIEKLKERM